MLSRNDHDALVARLYASASGELPWCDTLRHIADGFGTSAALVQISGPGGAVLSARNHGYSEEFAAAFYASEVYAKDPRLPHFRRVRPDTLYYDHALYDVEEMGRNPWCRASIETLKVKYQLGAVSGLPDGATGYVTLLSSAAEGHASEAAIGAFWRLAPHMKQALSLGQVLEQRAATQDILLDALANKADGVILLGQTGAPTFMNEAARGILAAGDGLALARGAFIARRGPETRKLQRMIGDAVARVPPSEARPGGEMLVTRSSGKRPYMVRVIPAPRTERFLTGMSIACVIHLHDLAAVRLPSRVLLSAAFGLSEREVDLVVELVRCASLADAATNAGMALNTARNHLHSVFRKSGTASQAEAVQLFSRLA